jgi:hypothetical protein
VCADFVQKSNSLNIGNVPINTASVKITFDLIHFASDCMEEKKARVRNLRNARMDK